MKKTIEDNTDESIQYLREVNVNFRAVADENVSAQTPSKVAGLVRKLSADNSREHFFAFYLDSQLDIVAYSIISIGTADRTPVHPREVFQRAVLVGACSIVVAHNHPTGWLHVSDADKTITRVLRRAGDVVGISVLDHIVVTETSDLSMFADRVLWNELMPKTPMEE